MNAVETSAAGLNRFTSALPFSSVSGWAEPAGERIDDRVVDAGSGERGEAAEREVADHAEQLTVGEDAAGADGLPQRGAALGMGEPLLQRGHGVEADGKRGGGHLDGGGEPQVARRGADRELERAALQDPPAVDGGPVGQVADPELERHGRRGARLEEDLRESLELARW